MLWLQFITGAGLIFIFGSRLSEQADDITKKSVFSAGFMGVLFLAVITSCPEIATSLGSITLVNAPDLAAGDLLGAVIINMLVIVMLASLYKKRSIFAGDNTLNILTAKLAILMLGLVIGFISLRMITDVSLGIFNVGIDSIIIGTIYVAGMCVIYKNETSSTSREVKEKIPLSYWINFVISAVIIIAAGFWLARTGKAIVDANKWSEMWMGLTFMAAATTLPEFVVSLSALKLNSPQMAVGNLLGSNFFNLFIITILDIFLRKGEFLSLVSRSNIYPAFLAMILISFILIHMRKRGK